jgi:hypothetical protein
VSALGLSLLSAQSPALPTFVVPNAPDLTIKTRRTFDHRNSSATTEIVYLKGARQRRETVVEWPEPVSTIVGSGRTHVATIITQCDERRTLSLNEEARTYAYSPIEDMSDHLERVGLAASRAAQRALSPTTGGDVMITIDSVDTGERRRIGRYTARRVITTTKTEPGPGASTRAGVAEQDGWYIDLPSASCWDRGEHAEAILVVVTRDRVQLKRVGTARRGYPIEETNRSRTATDTTTTTLELIDFSDSLLDAGLFTVPTGYRAALPTVYGGYDMTKPDTVRNRLESYWDALTVWVNHVFR